MQLSDTIQKLVFTVSINGTGTMVDISQFEASDFSDGVDATIYLFNTGSKVDVMSQKFKDYEGLSDSDALDVLTTGLASLAKAYGITELKTMEILNIAMIKVIQYYKWINSPDYLKQQEKWPRY